MFWKKQPTEREQLTEEAVDLACKMFTTGRLCGSDEFGWSDSEGIGDARTLAYRPSKYERTLFLSGLTFTLNQEQAARIENTIARRVLASLKKD